MKDPGASQVGALFDLRDYDRLLRTFLDRGYETVGYDEARARIGENRDRFVIWRHDIDFCLRRALAIARLENRAGVQTDYFVMVRSLMYNPLEAREISRFEEIRKLGHRIGLHFDASLYDGAGQPSLKDKIQRDCEILEGCLGEPVSMVTFHRPTESLLEAGISLDRRGHGYESDFFKEMAYFSDSRGSWSHGSPLESEAFAEGRPMQVLTHPIWWTGPAGQTPTQRLNEFSDGLLDEIRRNIKANCMTYEYQPTTTSTIDKDS